MSTAILASFTVAPFSSVVVSAANLMVGEQVAIEFAAYEDCDGILWEPYSPCGDKILVDEYYNPVIISTPGRYQAVPVGIINSEVRVSTPRVGAQNG